MKHFNWMSFYWIVIWFGLGFGIPETIALATGHSENTLSDQVWYIEGFEGHQRFFMNPVHWTAGHWVIFVGMVWLFGHFIDHVWR